MPTGAAVSSAVSVPSPRPGCRPGQSRRPAVDRTPPPRWGRRPRPNPDESRSTRPRPAREGVAHRPPPAWLPVYSHRRGLTALHPSPAGAHGYQYAGPSPSLPRSVRPVRVGPRLHPADLRVYAAIGPPACCGRLLALPSPPVAGVSPARRRRADRLARGDRRGPTVGRPGRAGPTRRAGGRVGRRARGAVPSVNATRGNGGSGPPRARLNNRPGEVRWCRPAGGGLYLAGIRRARPVARAEVYALAPALTRPSSQRPQFVRGELPTGEFRSATPHRTMRSGRRVTTPPASNETRPAGPKGPAGVVTLVAVGFSSSGPW